MEGYLYKKGRQESKVGRRNWKKRWFVLDGTFLIYFEDFDNTTRQPYNRKGVFPLLGCVAKPFPHHEKKYTFHIVHNQRSALYLHAESQKIADAWIAVINDAAKGELGPTSAALDEYYEALGIDPALNYGAAEVSRVYRQVALQVHPERGGDINEFKRVQEAYDIIMSKLEEDEFEKQILTIEYQATVRKGPQGVGFGIVVVEDIRKRQLKIKSVLPTVDIVSIDDASRGVIKPGDRLVQIGNDDCSNWTMPKVIQRLSDNVVPVGASVTLRLLRRVNKDGISTAPTETTATESMAYEEDASYAVEQRVSQPMRSNREDNGDYSDSHTENSLSYGDEGSESETGPSGTSAYDSNIDRSVEYPKFDSHLHDSALLELQRKVKELEERNNQLQEERDFVSEKIDDIIDERELLLNENAMLKVAAVESAHREEYYELQLQQAMLYTDSGGDLMMQSMRDMMAVSNLIKSGAPLNLTDEVEAYLENIGLGREASVNPIKDAQRMAIGAVSSVDTSGRLLRKWALSGDSCINKLTRFEARLKRLEDQELTATD